MYKGFYKVFLWTMVIALLFAVFSFSVSEGEEWTCPNCGRGGLMKNFCPSCGTARPEDPGIPFEFKIGDIVAFSSQENADDASDRFIWTVADIDGKVVTLVCISVLPETVVSLMDSETPEDAADFVKYVLIRKVLSEKEIAVIGETGDFEVSDCAAFSDLLIEKKDKYLVLRIESKKVAPFLILVEYAEKSMDEADAAATESPTVTPTLKLATATPKAQPMATATAKPATATPVVTPTAQPMATATATAKPATATPTVQPTVTATPVVTPTPTATQPAAYGHRHSDLDELKPWTNEGVYGHARLCNVCRELVGFATHTFPEEWTLEFAPSCRYEGREKKVCTVCGGEIYNWLEPTGVHKLGPMVAVRNNGVDGHGQKCSVCLEYINFAAHTYPDEWTLESAPSCTSQGREKKVCTVCGGEFYNWLAPTGHHYVDGFCSACGKKEP